MSLDSGLCSSMDIAWEWEKKIIKDYFSRNLNLSLATSLLQIRWNNASLSFAGMHLIHGEHARCISQGNRNKNDNA